MERAERMGHNRIGEANGGPGVLGDLAGLYLHHHFIFTFIFTFAFAFFFTFIFTFIFAFTFTFTPYPAHGWSLHHLGWQE